MARVTAVLLATDQPVGDRARLIASRSLDILEHVRTSRNDRMITQELPKATLLLNFLSAPKVAPFDLQRFSLAVNFHPAGPEYPGVGWASRAIYDRLTEAGATVHVMTPEYDAGPILDVRRFLVNPAWGYRALAERAHEECLALFSQWVDRLAVQWSGKAMTLLEYRRHPSFDAVPA